MLNNSIEFCGFGFVDEVSDAFFYDSNEKKIEIHFSGLYTLPNWTRQTTPCILIIEKWLDAKSKIFNTKKYEHLEKNLGIISLILGSDYHDDTLHLIVSTIDQNHIDLLFKNPKISVIMKE